MRKSKVISMGLVATVLLFSSCLQGGSSYKIVDTNQSKCFDDRLEIDAPGVGDIFYGQDAQHTGNTPSYTDNGDGTITDNVTGLMWRKGYQVMSFEEALEAVESFNLGGYNDWRIPSIKEAYSLILFSGCDVSANSTSNSRNTGTPFIDTDYFDFEYAANGNRAIDSQMLSSTLYVGSTPEDELLFGVNFADGRIKGYGLGLGGQAKQFVVRFVRGKEYGINKFVDNGDGTISDKATSLMWSQDDSQEAMNWQDALAYAQEMNSRNYRGHSDWRVPNAKELQSIVDYSRSPLSTSSASIDPMFNSSTIIDESGAEDYPFYWTSTTHENSGGVRGSAAVYVAFGRSLGNMSNTQNMGGSMPNASRRNNQSQGQQGEQGQRQRNGERPQMADGERPNMEGRERPEMGQQGEQGQRQRNGKRPQMADGERPNMEGRERPEMGQQGEQGQRQRNGERPQMADGERPNMEGRERPQMADGERPNMEGRQQSQQNRQGRQAQGEHSAEHGAASKPNWIDVHGAGSQRSDPKSGDASVYASGNGPQGDAIRINNYVRLVRDL